MEEKEKEKVVVENTEEKKAVAIKEKDDEVILKTPITYDNVKYEKIIKVN